jgi:hypothetical protein
MVIPQALFFNFYDGDQISIEFFIQISTFCDNQKGAEVSKQYGNVPAIAAGGHTVPATNLVKK